MIEIRNLTVMYGRKIAVENVNLRIEDGERIILMGPNGSGKTTILKAILDLVPYEGEVRMDGVEVRLLKRRELARNVAYVPQIFSTPYTFSVKEFVSMGLYSVLRDWLSADGVVEEAIEKVGLWDLREKSVNTLSGGELQKAVIARALVQDARYILMDEPTAHLDIKAVKEILDIVESMRDKGLILVSHDLNPLNRIHGTLALLRNGRLEFAGKKGDPKLPGKLEEVFGIKVAEFNDALQFELS
ncbi:MAG: ABC transporter ATP-binding protein [Thermoplasmata archaeon]